MGWLSKIFKGSNHKVSEGRYDWRYGSDAVENHPSTSWESWSEVEDIDRAIALSLSEEDQKGNTVVASISDWADQKRLGPDGWISCNASLESDSKFSMSGSYPYHKTCYKDSYHPKCDICNHFIPTNVAGLIEYRAHPFWSQKYCPSHEHDGTPRCCSCERMESWDARYASLNDGRKLCLECLDSAIMDTDECQPLFLDIQEFFEGLNMKVTQQVPLLLVERQALNEAMDGERHGHHHMPETRGLCLSEEQTVSTILRRPRIGGNRVSGMRTEPYKLTRHCEVTAILILYGLPRLLTGSILAHEMMHAWLRLNGYRTLRQDVEEGICQVIASMWLESQILSMSDGNHASTSSSSSVRSPFEKKLSVFFKHQIATDTSIVYGNGFRTGNQAVLKFGLQRTLDHIRETGNFPY
ncbi:hypothetical protein BUALT_Bualt08G0061900 [Buddleja alternifolia]|uniref:Protein DA1-like domain-containing protein n=1 Tax=Buddleja alternifolia TaxID=168488 RepID=A0AAV6X5E0_9LAMI|nr:hypothetical protein BUALT_Bualt08G0061900 [Buddleja alternifolia]